MSDLLRPRLGNEIVLWLPQPAPMTSITIRAAPDPVIEVQDGTPEGAVCASHHLCIDSCLYIGMMNYI